MDFFISNSLMGTEMTEQILRFVDGMVKIVALTMFSPDFVLNANAWTLEYSSIRSRLILTKTTSISK